VNVHLRCDVHGLTPIERCGVVYSAYSYHRDNGFFVDDPGERSFLFVDSSVSTTAMRARVCGVYDA